MTNQNDNQTPLRASDEASSARAEPHYVEFWQRVGAAVEAHLSVEETMAKIAGAEWDYENFLMDSSALNELENIKAYTLDWDTDVWTEDDNGHLTPLSARMDELRKRLA